MKFILASSPAIAAVVAPDGIRAELMPDGSWATDDVFMDKMFNTCCIPDPEPSPSQGPYGADAVRAALKLVGGTAEWPIDLTPADAVA